MPFDEMKVIGLMSGTSVDGLDIAYCEFKKLEEGYSYTIGASSTIDYPEGLRDSLKNILHADPDEIEKLDQALGVFFGKAVSRFISNNELKPDLIASHGHTVFHQPEKGITLQIGDGKRIYELTNIPVAYDFRSKDVSLGGQGAPLVPIGDRYLFGEYDYCLNLGGIANISLEKNGERIAWDICPMNLILNRLAQRKGLEYDRRGELAKAGKIDQTLLDKLNALDYYEQTPPKSLGLEWIKEKVFPLLDECQSTENALATCVEHIVTQISQVVDADKKILVTGGGAHNSYLISCLRKKVQVVVPDSKLVNYKEALIFAFLGFLRVRGEVNVLKSVTGAKEDSVSGEIVGYF